MKHLQKPAPTQIEPARQIESAPGARETVPTAAGAPPEETPLTPEQVADLKARAAKADEHWDRLLRLAAEFDNSKKRLARERDEAIKYANMALLEKLIPALDSFEVALTAAADQPAATPETFKTGMALIHQQITGALREAGLEEIDATGQPFDPNLHEAISQQESAEVPEGRVLQQVRKGYKLRDRLLRPAAVVVARRPAA